MWLLIEFSIQNQEATNDNAICSVTAVERL